MIGFLTPTTTVICLSYGIVNVWEKRRLCFTLIGEQGSCMRYQARPTCLHNHVVQTMPTLHTHSSIMYLFLLQSICMMQTCNSSSVCFIYYKELPGTKLPGPYKTSSLGSFSTIIIFFAFAHKYFHEYNSCFITHSKFCPQNKHFIINIWLLLAKDWILFSYASRVV